MIQSDRNPLLAQLAEYLNPYVARSPLRLFEIADQRICPPTVRRCCQNVLASEWTHRLPFIQPKSPAELAATVIVEALDDFAELDDSGLAVVDFCSGSGGPVPTIEKAVNRRRKERGLSPVSFLMTDLNPHVDAWKAASAKSSHLSFIPESVDATHPPSSVINASSDPENRSSNLGPKRRIFRLYCLCFHHFSDPMARQVLASTLDTADGFAILELQDRRLASFVLMVLDFFFIFLMTPFWFGADPTHLFFTYIFPVVPFIMSFDGIVSSLRTRTFGEVMQLIDSVKGDNETEKEFDKCPPLKQLGKADRFDWELRGGREVHTWPLGYFNYIVGRRKNQRSDT
ncbi:hypothetical protein BKA81DRAFT_31827 [Phyllosticta paracitricarpa]|uniref:Uncharacterized protein n=2 Tax=Phyllosticta TaxID=121621 RepID=A0ABR1MER3_9PEZI